MLIFRQNPRISKRIPGADFRDIVSLEKEIKNRYDFGVDYNTVLQSRARLKAKLKSSRKLKK